MLPAFVMFVDRRPQRCDRTKGVNMLTLVNDPRDDAAPYAA
jgi:hypothetical protein